MDIPSLYVLYVIRLLYQQQTAWVHLSPPESTWVHGPMYWNAVHCCSEISLQKRAALNFFARAIVAPDLGPMCCFHSSKQGGVYHKF